MCRDNCRERFHTCSLTSRGYPQPAVCTSFRIACEHLNSLRVNMKHIHVFQ